MVEVFGGGRLAMITRTTWLITIAIIVAGVHASGPSRCKLLQNKRVLHLYNLKWAIRDILTLLPLFHFYDLRDTEGVITI